MYTTLVFIILMIVIGIGLHYFLNQWTKCPDCEKQKAEQCVAEYAKSHNIQAKGTTDELEELFNL